MTTTPTSVPISIRNLFTSQALVQLYHENASGLDTHGGGWIIPARGTAFAFNVLVNPTYGNNWRVKVTTWGPGGAVYENHGTGMNGFTFGMLTGGDAAGVTFSVSANQFSLPLAGGPISINMTNTGPYHPITNVFVLMLENHSCDNIFAGSGIAGLTKATTSNSTSYNGISYPVVPVAPYSLTTDPGHEFLDVVQQLTGRSPSAWTDGQTYPPITLSGFAANYATSGTEDTGVPGSAVL